VRTRVKIVLPSSFLAPTTTKRKKTIKSTKTYYPSNPNPSFNPTREVRKEIPKLRDEAFICIFCGHAGHLDEFYSVTRESRRCALIMLEIDIIMSLLVFWLILLLMLHLISFMGLTIAHMILVHERTTLCLYTLVTAHVLIVVIVPRVGTVFLLEGLILALSPDTSTVHVFPVVVHIPLV
jgi:hypothetical protein